MARPSNRAMTAAIRPIRLLWLFLLTAALALATLPATTAEAQGPPNLELNFLNVRGDVDHSQDRLGSFQIIDGQLELGPIQVEVLRNGSRVNGGRFDVALSLCEGEVCVLLDEVRAQRGLADFGVIALKEGQVEVQSGYTLKATSPDVDKDEINVVVWESVAHCNGEGSCVASANRDQQQTVDVGAAAGQGALLLSLLDDELVCPERSDAHRQAPLATLLDSPGVDGSKTATITIDKALVDADENRGNYQVCFQEVDEAGDFFGDAFWLERCTSSEAPCIESRTKTGAGDAVIEIKLPPGDPMFR